MPIALLLALVLPLLAWTTAALAEEPAAAPASAPAAELLADPDALARWLEAHSPTVQAAAANVKGARAGISTARELPNPTLDLGVGNAALGTANPPGLPLNQQLVYDVGIEQPIELGKRGPRIEAAEKSAAAARSGFAATLGEQMAAARQAIARAATLESRQRILEEAAADARDSLGSQKVRLDHGDISGADYDRLVLDSIALDSRVSGNRADLEAARASCDAILAAPCELGGIDPTTLPAAAPLPAELPTDVANRADIRATKLEAAASRSEATLARRKAIPDPSVRVDYTHSRFTISGDQPNVLGVGLSIPLPVFAHGSGEAARADARARELERQATAAIQGAQADLSSLRERQSALEARLQQLETDALPRSESVLESARKAFDQGEYALTDLLLARRAHTDLLLDSIDARLQLFETRNELRKALGLDARTR